MDWKHDADKVRPLVPLLVLLLAWAYGASAASPVSSYVGTVRSTIATQGSGTVIAGKITWAIRIDASLTVRFDWNSMTKWVGVITQHSMDTANYSYTLEYPDGSKDIYDTVEERRYWAGNPGLSLDFNSDTAPSPYRMNFNAGYTLVVSGKHQLTNGYSEPIYREVPLALFVVPDGTVTVAAPNIQGAGEFGWDWVGALGSKVVTTYNFVATLTGSGTDPCLGPTTATMIDPVPGSTLTGATTTFTWGAGRCAGAYWLDVGNAKGIGDISAGQLPSTTLSKTVSGIPTDGRTIYVRLWTMLYGQWQYNDHTYVAAGTAAATSSISAPAPGSALTDTNVTFSWSTTPGADQYWLDVGNSAGVGDLSAGVVTAPSKTVTGLPCDGRTLYVQLWTHLNGTWRTPQRVTYTACRATAQGAQIISPVPGSTLVNWTVSFAWTMATGADNYWLDVGNSAGQGDISAGATPATSRTVGGLPCDGRTLYVQLWTHLNGAWLAPQRYTYTSGCGSAARIISPVPGTALTDTTVMFTWNTIAAADNYWLDVGNSVTQGDISAGATAAASKTVSGLPCDGRTLWVQLWTHLNGAWLTPQRVTYTACNNGAPQVAHMVTPPPGNPLNGMAETFRWSTAAVADQYWLDVGNSPGKGDIFAMATTDTQQLVDPLPCDGRTLYVQLWTHMLGAWQPPERYTYRAGNCIGDPAQMISPRPGTRLPGGTVTFTWSAVTDAYYSLDVGYAKGQHGIFSLWPYPQTTSQTVNGLPTNGTPVYARLWTFKGAWQYVDYTYTTGMAPIALRFDTCPQNDPAYNTIRADFEIRREGVVVGAINCTEPATLMPLAAYTDELSVLQSLRMAYYMDLGRTNYLPWTAKRFYDWLKSEVRGVNLTAAANANTYCCDVFNGQPFIALGFISDDLNRVYKLSFLGAMQNTALFGHEARHLDGFVHTSSSNDANYNENSLSPFGIQYWLYRAWLNGTISLGLSCLPAAPVSYDANWILAAANGYIGRFDNIKPPVVTMPAQPFGVCSENP
jgi:hypothetical protein